MQHKFAIRTHTSAHTTDFILKDTVVLAIVAILTSGLPRVRAIKALRELTAGTDMMGLYEAKQIVDWLADNASIDPAAGFILNPPKVTVEYTSLPHGV
jgi:ribosomal protein L7/L12